jgi:hypothetical protein
MYNSGGASIRLEYLGCGEGMGFYLVLVSIGPTELLGEILNKVSRVFVTPKLKEIYCVT